MVKIEERLLETKAIFLNLTLQERATGLDDIVGDFSSFFNLAIYFWNLSKLNATRIVLRERNEERVEEKLASSSELEKFLDLDLEQSFSLENLTNAVQTESWNSPLCERLKDKRSEAVSTVEYPSRSFSSVINALIQVYESKETGIYIVENINQLLSSDTLDIFQYEQIKTWIIKLTQKARETPDFYLVLLGSSEAKWEFEELAPLVKLPYLKHYEITQILVEKFTRLKLKDSDKYELIEKAGHILTGMSKPELHWGITNITNSLKEDNTVAAYIAGLLEFKQNKLSGLGLSFLPSPEVSTVGGMDILKNNIDNLKILFSCDRQKYNLPQEQGWALVGVPGAGKSLVAKVMQSELALPMIYIPIDKVKDRGPAYLAHVLELCEAYAPNIVYIDELDKMFTGGDLEGDAATTLAVFLTWLQEKQAPCFVLATLNRLDTLPPELLRSGRFSEVFYVGFPQPNERREIYKLYLKQYDSRYKQDFLDQEQWLELIDESIKFTGAEIAAVVKKAYKAKFFERRQAIKKLQNCKFESLDLLKQIIADGYKAQYQELSKYHLDLENLDRQISKILTDLSVLPNCVKQLDRLYGQLTQDLDNGNVTPSQVGSASTQLENLVNRGYKAIYERMATKTIGLNELEAMTAQALADFDGQERQIDEIEKIYAFLLSTEERLTALESKPLQIDYDALIDFTIAEIPLYERAVEKVMKIENDARRLCKPVSSVDKSNLVDKEPSFWKDMKPAEAVQIINTVRQAEAEKDGTDYEPITSLDEEVGAEDNQNYWAF